MSIENRKCPGQLNWSLPARATISIDLECDFDFSTTRMRKRIKNIWEADTILLLNGIGYRMPNTFFCVMVWPAGNPTQKTYNSNMHTSINSNWILSVLNRHKHKHTQTQTQIQILCESCKKSWCISTKYFFNTL